MSGYLASPKPRALSYLTGQVLKLSQGKANPKMVADIIKERIEKVRERQQEIERARERDAEDHAG